MVRWVWCHEKVVGASQVGMDPQGLSCTVVWMHWGSGVLFHGGSVMSCVGVGVSCVGVGVSCVGVRVQC